MVPSDFIVVKPELVGFVIEYPFARISMSGPNVVVAILDMLKFEGIFQCLGCCRCYVGLACCFMRLTSVPEILVLLRE